MAIKSPKYKEGTYEIEEWVETYIGAVLCAREENGYHDSDFYVIVWDEEDQETKRIVYATTRFAGGGAASVDATPEVIEKAVAYTEKKIFDKLLLAAPENFEKGKTAVAVKGRKIPIGTEGTIFWLGKKKYANDWRNDRLGIETKDRERLFSAKNNFEIPLSEEDIAALARTAKRVAPSNLHTLFVSSNYVAF